MDYLDALHLVASHGAKAERALRRYRQGCFDSEAKARAVHRIKRTKTWQALAMLGASRTSHYAGRASGYSIP